MTMMRIPIIGILAATAVAALAAAAARPVTLTKTQAAAITKEIARDRADTEKWLKGDLTSYLAAVERHDFGAKTTLTIGRAPDNDVRLDDAAVSAHHVRIAVEGDTFRVAAVDKDATFLVKDKPQ